MDFKLNDESNDDLDAEIELCLVSERSSSEEYFDRVIGYIEEIIMEEKFQDLRKDFFENNWKVFEDTEENKIEYMTIFQNYTKIFEEYIVNEINKRMDDFNMSIFAKCLEDEKPPVDSEIFDIIQSLFDFLTFKEIMLDYKCEKEGKFDQLKDGLIVKKLSDDDSNN